VSGRFDNSDPSAVAEYWLAKSEAALASAASEHAAGRFDFALNRAYYAAFYAASAALIQRGKRFVKHSGLRGAVHRELVHAGLIDAEVGRVFDRLFEARQRADYLDLVDVEGPEAAAAIEAARGFVAAMRRLAEQP
jgi:uncharacterized protein (UPF0332 family)